MYDMEFSPISVHPILTPPTLPFGRSPNFIKDGKNVCSHQPPFQNPVSTPHCARYHLILFGLFCQVSFLMGDEARHLTQAFRCEGHT